MNDELNENLILLPEEELLSKLGQSILKPSLGMKSASTREYITVATKWLNKNRQKLIELVCLDERIISFQKSERSKERLVLAAAILDLIAAHFTGISVASVAVLLANEGLESLCTNCNPQTANTEK